MKAVGRSLLGLPKGEVSPRDGAQSSRPTSLRVLSGQTEATKGQDLREAAHSGFLPPRPGSLGIRGQDKAPPSGGLPTPGDIVERSKKSLSRDPVLLLTT